MLTAQDIQKALTALDRIDRMTIAQSQDPSFIGALRADAFCASLPLKYALGAIQVQIEKNPEKELA